MEQEAYLHNCVEKDILKRKFYRKGKNMSENKKKQLNHRTILFTCALDKKRFAIENNPFIDVSLLDVEDSVPQEKKILARSNVIEYFSNLQTCGTTNL